MVIRKLGFLLIAAIACGLITPDLSLAQGKGGGKGSKGGGSGGNRSGGNKGGGNNRGGNKDSKGKSAEEKRQERKDKEAAEKAKEGVKPPTNLDEAQLAALEFLDEKAYPKLYEMANDPPEEAKKLVYDQFYTTIYGTHRPDRAQSDKVIGMLIEELRGGRLPGNQATSLTDATAEVLSSKILSKESLDGFKVAASKLLLRTRVADVRQTELLTEIEKLIRESKSDAAKLKARETAEAARKAAEKKKRDEEAEKEKKRQERKSGGNKEGR